MIIFLARAETAENTSSTVEAATESVCGQDVNQSLSKPTKYIPLTVHKAPELTKLQAAPYVGVRLRDSSLVPRRRPFIIGTHYVL